MNSTKRLIAFDMDGTLLNDRKELTPRTLAAIRKADAAGKYVVLNTGRNPKELTPFLKFLPAVRYVNCVSGALVRDLEKNVTVFSRCLDPEMVLQLFELASQEVCMVHLHTEDSIAQKDQVENMTLYRMGVYSEAFHTLTRTIPDLRAWYTAEPFPCAKVNLYHATTEGRERTRARALALGLPVEMADSELSSLEFSPAGIHKGIGLMKLCAYLGISAAETVVVGDADNDLRALETAGLAVAVANANEHVMAIADAVVADNNHDGCAEAIEKYLL